MEAFHVHCEAPFTRKYLIALGAGYGGGNIAVVVLQHVLLQIHVAIELLEAYITFVHYAQMFCSNVLTQFFLRSIRFITTAALMPEISSYVVVIHVVLQVFVSLE